MFRQTDPTLRYRIKTVDTADVGPQIQQILFFRMIQKTGHISAAGDRTVPVDIIEGLCDLAHNGILRILRA